MSASFVAQVKDVNVSVQNRFASMCKACRSPKVLAISGFVFAPICLALLIFAITEKFRFNPLNRPLQCVPPPASGTPFSLMSAPTGVAEGFGLVPGQEPYGIYTTFTSKTKCTNPGPTAITIRSAGYEAQILAPNATDIAAGGHGLNYSVIGSISLARDAVFSSGGQDEMILETELAQSLALILAAMTPESTMQGFSVGYVKSVQTLQTCFSLLGLAQCVETKVEQFCGSYSGACLAETLDSSGVPVEPAQFEAALCVYSKSLCGKEADVHAQLDPEALGINITGQVPCAAATGLPNTSMCNTVTSLGVDPATHLARNIEPSTVLTVEAQAEAEAELAAAESMINLMLNIAIGLYAFFFITNLLQGILCCRKHRRLAREAKTGEV